MPRAPFLLIGTFLIALCLSPLAAQDAATGAIRGTVLDPSNSRIAKASIVAVRAATGARYLATSDSEGRFSIDLLPPGDYTARVTADKMSPQVTPTLHVEVGAAAEMEFHLTIAGPQENVTVSSAPQTVDTQSTDVSTLLDERAISDLPLNGRRFFDLILLSPGVTQDPRSLTSATNGDLSFGGIRGFQNSFLVDGGDFNNAFFAQARGLYRAPYQFSNEVVQEFRVSTNSYGAEMGRAGGAVINVVTKSGSNHWHGTGLYYIRDSSFGASDPFLPFKPQSRQQHGGATLGGPIKKNKIFFFGGFDQHYFHVPNVVEFLDGTMQFQPQAGIGPYSPGDYEASDQALVFAAAAQLNSLAGAFPAAQIGNAAYAKLDINLTPRNQLGLRYNSSRYWGSNNVFLDPASPITYESISDNGEETVSTDTGSLTLTSGLSPRVISHLRAQFSRDLRQSYTNAPPIVDGAPITTLLKITNVLDGIGRSDQLPRATREHRAQLAETLSIDTSHHSLKFGGDALITWLYDFFPTQQSGEYIFDIIKVNQFTFDPQESGLPLTPLRAYAHDVPHYYLQNFGPSSTNPNSNDYAAFAQDTIRATSHLALNLGVRWDLQTFTNAGLISNPLFPPSGKVPYNPRNFAPRAGLAYSLGKSHPLVVRAGYGLFYVRIPQIYNSAIASENGITDAQVFLNNTQQYPQYNGHSPFPTYPNPLVTCSPTTSSCNLPAGFTQGVTNEVSAFAPNFTTPRVQQASLTLEREVAGHTTIAVSYLYVHGERLIRALDVNLPNPATLAPLGDIACNAPVAREALCTYPVFNSIGPVQNAFYSVDSFATWQFTQSLTCPFPPCINPLGRPIAQLGSIDEFQSAASSLYNGATVSINRRVSRGSYLRISYTYARAIDDGQDALVAGEPATVQNSYNPNAERGPSVTDQRNRLVAAFSIEPRPFHREHEFLGHIFNNWKLSSIVTAGSGRPVNATVYGDPNQDGNYDNDRLPGYSRNAFTGPDYSSTDLRLVRKIHVGQSCHLDLTADSFNLFNRDNKRVLITSDGLTAEATTFTPYSVFVNGVPYPGYYNQPQNFLKPTAAFAPRQVQLGVKFIY
jgi:hypothetical protein